MTVDEGHPGDVARPFLSARGQVNGLPFSMDMPRALAIADNCDSSAASGDFDRLDGCFPLPRSWFLRGNP